MAGRFDEQVALVSGGARGIGAATAKRLAADGASVVVLDTSEAACEQTVDEIRRAGGQAIPIACDVAESRDVERAVEATVSGLGGVDILVSNAGIVRASPVAEMTDKDWDDVIAVHLRGGFLLSRACQRHMVEQRHGKIVFTSSRAASGKAGIANYAAAKAGLNGFARSLALELGPSNINVNVVAPGFIRSDMSRLAAERAGMSFEEFVVQMERALPMRRGGFPKDVANVITFLCSEEASYVTGQVIVVAGDIS